MKNKHHGQGNSRLLFFKKKGGKKRNSGGKYEGAEEIS